jgi:hypothetical protein
VATAQGFARLSAQRSAILLMQQFLYQDQVVPHSWTALMEYLDMRLKDNINFVRPKDVTPPQLSSLTSVNCYL